VDNYVVNPSIEVLLEYRARIKDRGPIRVDLLRSEDGKRLLPLLTEIRDSASLEDVLHRIPDETVKFLQDVGVLVNQSDSPDRVRFECPLTQDNLKRVPQDAWIEYEPLFERPDLIINPSLVMQTESTRPQAGF
jgi:hypothetical protein